MALRGIRLNGQPIVDAAAPIAVKSGDILQRGKRWERESALSHTLLALERLIDRGQHCFSRPVFAGAPQFERAVVRDAIDVVGAAVSVGLRLAQDTDVLPGVAEANRSPKSYS